MYTHLDVDVLACICIQGKRGVSDLGCYASEIKMSLVVGLSIYAQDFQFEGAVLCYIHMIHTQIHNLKVLCTVIYIYESVRELLKSC